MRTAKKLGYGTISAVAGLTMAATMAAGSAAALEAGTPADAGSGSAGDAATQTTKTALAQAGVVKTAAVGTFAYDQTTVTSTADIAKFQGASAVLCGARDASSYVDPLAQQIAVSGDVSNAFSATVDELVGEDSVNQVMTCSCGGNPAGGRAIVTADVKGIPIEYLLSRAGASTTANTVVFIGSDGTQVAMPIGYVIGRHGVLSCEVNGENAYEAVGVGNQLWLSKTPANYFVRNVVEIVVLTQEVAPATPGADAVHPNSPNAGILSGAQG